MIDEQRLVELIKQVIDANPILVNYQTLDSAGNEVDSGRVDSVKLGGELRVPPQITQIRDGDEIFVIGANLGAPIKMKVENLKVSGT